MSSSSRSSHSSIGDENNAYPVPNERSGSQFDQAEYFLSVGETVQRLNIIRQLPSLFKADQKKCLLRVLPLVQSALRRENYELHVEAADAYLQILSSQLVSLEDFASVFLPSILSYFDANDIGVFAIWVNFVMQLLDKLPQDYINRRIFQLVHEKCHLNASAHQKAAAAQLLGKMCSRYDEHAINTRIWPLLQSLSQEDSPLVKASVCQQLNILAERLPAVTVRKELIPCLIELVRDDDLVVQCEAVDVVVHLVRHAPQADLEATVLPLVLSICHEAINTITEVTARLAANLSLLCYNLSHRGVLNTERLTKLVDVYCKISSFKRYPDTLDIEKSRLHVNCRRLCAEHLADMLKLENLGMSQKLLLRSFAEFALDPSPIVRKTVAESLYKFGGLPGDVQNYVKKALAALLRDDNEEVLSGVIPVVDKTIKSLLASNAFQGSNDPIRLEIAKCLLSRTVMLKKSYNWRLKEQLYTELASTVKFAPEPFVYTHVYRKVFETILAAGPMPVRYAAAGTSLVLLRYSPNRRWQQAIRERIYNELFKSDSCYRRIIFINLCQTALTVFSSAYFLTYFLDQVLSLGNDKVINVRLELAELLPPLAACMRHDERGYHKVTERLNMMLNQETDKDTKDLLLAAHKVIAARAKNPKEHDGGFDAKEDARKHNEEMKLKESKESAYVVANQPPLPQKIAPKKVSKPHTNEPVPARSHSQSKISRPIRPAMQTKPVHQSSSATSHRERVKSTNPPNTKLCTCVSSGLAMEMSWLNLETDMQRELRAFAPFTSIFEYFSSAFESEFYRDAGVRPGDILKSSLPATRSHIHCSGDFMTSSPATLLKSPLTYGVTTSGKHSCDFPPISSELTPSLTASMPNLLARTGRSKSFVLPSTKFSKSPLETPIKTTRIPISNRRSMDVSNWSTRLEARSQHFAPSVGVSRLPVRKGRP